MEAEPQAKAVPEARSKPSRWHSREKAKKLSFKERRELEELPKRIEALELELSPDPRRDGQPRLLPARRAEITRANARLEAIEAELATSFERWETTGGAGRLSKMINGGTGRRWTANSHRQGTARGPVNGRFPNMEFEGTL